MSGEIIGHKLKSVIFNPFSAGIDLKHQNLTFETSDSDV